MSMRRLIYDKINLKFSTWKGKKKRKRKKFATFIDEISIKLFFPNI